MTTLRGPNFATSAGFLRSELLDHHRGGDGAWPLAQQLWKGGTGDIPAREFPKETNAI